MLAKTQPQYLLFWQVQQSASGWYEMQVRDSHYEYPVTIQCSHLAAGACFSAMQRMEGLSNECASMASALRSHAWLAQALPCIQIHRSACSVDTLAVWCLPT